MDMDIAIDSVADVRSCLDAADCRMIVFDPEDGRLELLRKAIPEFYHCEYLPMHRSVWICLGANVVCWVCFIDNDSNGQWFHSKYYPNLKFFLHTGFDIEMGCVNLKRWMQPTPTRTAELEKRVQSLSDDMPLFSTATKDGNGVKISEWLTHGDVQKQKQFTLADKLTQKEYFEM
jgi:hypothetical protein